MSRTTLILFLLPVLTYCSSDGNIHLFEEDVAIAIQSCSNINYKTVSKDYNAKRPRRSTAYVYPSDHIDASAETIQYNHERRNTGLNNKTHYLNKANSENSNYWAESDDQKLINTIPNLTLKNINAKPANIFGNSTRTKRNEPLISKDDNEQCLSQCVFANLQVVDSRGIPREPELWNKVQTSVTSQQSRSLLKDQIRACFQELESESEDNGCSYSNKLDRCLMLRFSERKLNSSEVNLTANKN